VNLIPALTLALFAGLAQAAAAQQNAAPATRPDIAQIRSQIQGEIPVTTGPREFAAGHYAIIHTTSGDIVIRLFEDSGPKSVAYFVALAQGKTPWTHPITKAQETRPAYEGTLFYKVVPDALVFGGDPINRGEGDAGGSIDHEFGRDDDFSSPGTFALQTNGPKSAGSRFLITLRPFPEYEPRHTALGRVVAGLDVVQTISNAIPKRPTIPLDPDVLRSIEFLKVPEGKLARGEFRLEEGRPVLSMEPGFVDDPAAAPAPATKAEDPATSPTTDGDQQTTPSGSVQ
jgi:peptidyl-prolyl cis-trans isomerase A (cyclophilin A)